MASTVWLWPYAVSITNNALEIICILLRVAEILGFESSVNAPSFLYTLIDIPYESYIWAIKYTIGLLDRVGIVWFFSVRTEI